MALSVDGFYLWRNALGHSTRLAISREEFDDLSQGRKRITNVRDIEEKFFVICRNYRDIEMFKFGNDLEHLLFNYGETRDLYLIGTEMGRLALSFLASTKLYLDSVSSHARDALSNKSGIVEDVKNYISFVYDSSIEYRVMEMLRNHAQHHAFIVTAASYGGVRDKNTENIDYSSNFYFETRQIKDGKNLKPLVIKEVDLLGGRVDIVEFIRSYFSSMCNIHIHVRSLLESQSNYDSNLFKYIRRKWVATFPESADLTGVVAGHLKEGIIDKAVELS